MLQKSLLPLLEYMGLPMVPSVDNSLQISELLANYNETQRLKFEQCKAGKQGYNCWYDVRTGGTPTGALDHGEQIRFNITSTGYREDRDYYTGEVKVTSTSSSFDGVSLFRSCPDEFVGPTRSDSFTCVKVEKKSCAADGNPINIGTGDKFEQEVDFSTADGLLKIERVYVNQFSNWTFNSPYKLAVVNAGGTAPAPDEFSSVRTYSRYALDPIDPWRSELYTEIHTPQYVNPLSQRVAYLMAGRQRDRFVEQGSVFIGDGPTGARTKLVEINPANSSGAQWKVTHENGDVSFFLPNGNIQRTELAGGGSLSYHYSGQRLLSKADHLGRSLVYGYDSDNRLTSISLPDAQIITYEYGVDKKAVDYRLLKKVTWPNGESIGYIYNESERKN